MIGTRQEALVWLINSPEGDYEVKVHKLTRSLTANAYYWQLVSKIALAVGSQPEEIHRQNILHWAPVLIEFETETHEDLTKRGEGYYFYQGKNPISGRYMWRWKKGSSDMDSTEFNLLVDKTVEEAKALGIETLPPAELERLKDEAKKHNTR